MGCSIPGVAHSSVKNGLRNQRRLTTEDTPTAKLNGWGGEYIIFKNYLTVSSDVPSVTMFATGRARQSLALLVLFFVASVSAYIAPEIDRRQTTTESCSPACADRDALQEVRLASRGGDPESCTTDAHLQSCAAAGDGDCCRPTYPSAHLTCAYCLSYGSGIDDEERERLHRSAQAYVESEHLLKGIITIPTHLMHPRHGCRLRPPRTTSRFCERHIDHNCRPNHSDFSSGHQDRRVRSCERLGK